MADRTSGAGYQGGNVIALTAGDRVRLADRTPPDTEEFRIAHGKTGKVRSVGSLMVYVDWSGISRTLSYHYSWIVKA